MATLVGGPAAGMTVDPPAKGYSTLWVAVVDGAARVLDIWDDQSARELLNRVERGGWSEYEQDRGQPDVYWARADPAP